MKIVCTSDEFNAVVNNKQRVTSLRPATAEDIALALTGIADMDNITRHKYMTVANTLNRLLKTE